MRYTLTVPFVAAKGRPRAGNGRIYTPEKTRKAEDDIGKRWIAQHGGRLLFAQGVRVHLDVDIYVRDPLATPDVTNVIKLVEDALNSIAYSDDKQITHVTAGKSKTVGEPRIDITLEEDV